MSETLIQRAQLLIDQARYEDASEILTKVLADNPNDPTVLAMLSEVNLRWGRSKEALRLIESAIGIDPSNDYLFFLKAYIKVELTDLKEAEACLTNALAMNPSEPEYYGLMASIKVERKDYEAGLEFANKGLELDPENLFSLNVRGKALLKLGRKEESFGTLHGALSEDPDNPMTHANFGWAELEKGDHKKALTHFREALRVNPSLEYAQAGMAEALKARYVLYRIFLSYAFFMSNLTAKYQWAVIIGFYVGFRLLRFISDTNPELAPILEPVLIGLAITAFSTWVTAPISNLFLRLNTYGKHLLDSKEKMSSNLVGFCVIVLLIGLTGYLLNGDNTSLAVAVFGFAMMVPASSVFASSKQKYALPIYALAMLVVGCLAILGTILTGELYNTYTTVFIFGFIGFQWFANYVMISESNY